MVKQAKTTKRTASKTTGKKASRNTAAKHSAKSKVAFQPTLVSLLVSTASVLILFSLAFIVTR